MQDRVIYARKGGEEGVLSNSTNLGGKKITVEEACVSFHISKKPDIIIHSLQSLKSVCWGGPNIVRCQKMLRKENLNYNILKLGPETGMDQNWAYFQPCRGPQCLRA